LSVLIALLPNPTVAVVVRSNVTVVRHSLTAAVAWAQSNHGGKCSSQLIFHLKKSFSEKEESFFCSKISQHYSFHFAINPHHFYTYFNIFFWNKLQLFPLTVFPNVGQEFLPISPIESHSVSSDCIYLLRDQNHDG
jgi:hypothetical protein